MFHVGLRTQRPDAPFRHQLPVFNWSYPFPSATNAHPSKIRALWSLTIPTAGRTGVYVHIPFCETICRFCPFTRGTFASPAMIEEYVQALVREIRLKRDIIGSPTIQCVYIGGGSPSVLSVGSILRLGDCISENFRVATNAEFSVELEPKSITLERLIAFRRIGVNRVSIGVQSFDEEIRKLFNLTATLRQVDEGVHLATSTFPYVNIDVIYGTLKRELRTVEQTLQAATDLRTTTIDFYPLNNIAAQPSMHRRILEGGAAMASAMDRRDQRRHILDQMTGHGLCRINGYSYGRTANRTDSVVQTHPRFLYHDILYGHSRDVVIGYGAGALSYTPDAVFANTPDRTAYARRLLEANLLSFDAYMATGVANKGLMTFPYRGMIDKGSIFQDDDQDGLMLRVADLIDAGLVVDKGDRLEVSESGWLYYVNMMYYLLPKDGKKWLSYRIANRLAKGVVCEDTSLDRLE